MTMNPLPPGVVVTQDERDCAWRIGSRNARLQWYQKSGVCDIKRIEPCDPDRDAWITVGRSWNLGQGVRGEYRQHWQYSAASKEWTLK